MSKLIYTETDEAPMLATYSLLPVIQRFAKPMGIEVGQENCLIEVSVDYLFRFETVLFSKQVWNIFKKYCKMLGDCVFGPCQQCHEVESKFY